MQRWGFKYLAMALFLSASFLTSCGGGGGTPAISDTTTMKVPDTGQTTKYSTAFGDDSDYTINPPSYTDNGDGTITDNVTGLMWQKQDDGTTKTWESAITYCENLSLVGNSDWRLPNIKELGSLVDDTVFNPAINSAYFPATVSSNYWSATTYAYATSGAWYVVFNAGYVGTLSKSNTYYVRCVRLGQ